MSKKIMLLGASLESDNRGVNALGIGAITILKNSYPDSEIFLLLVGSRADSQKIIFVDGQEVSIDLFYFPKYDFLKSIVEAYLHNIFKISEIMDISRLINKSDMFFDINEGDSFSDIYGFKRIVRHFFDSKLILSWNKHLIFLPQTIGPFNSVIGKFLGKHILKRLSKIFVRDTKAKEFLQGINVDYELAIDMAVYMAPKEIDIDIKDNTIGVNINGLMFFNRYGSMEGKYDHYEKFLVKLIKEISNRGFNIFLIPHTYNANLPNEEDDLEAIQVFLKENPDLKRNIDYLDKNYTAQEIKYVLSKMEFFMGSRMHACIGALSKSVPTIGLSYSYKFAGTFKMFELEDHVIELNNLSEEQIDVLIQEILLRIDQRKETKITLEESNIRNLPKFNF